MLTFEQRTSLARTGDMSRDAQAFRLRAARESLRPPLSQLELAERIGLPVKTYSSQETARARPSDQVMQFFRREHEIDFNFIIHGDFVKLPGDVQDRLFAAMTELAARTDRTADSGRTEAPA